MNSVILAINIITKLSIKRIVINSKIQKYLLNQNLDSKSQHNIRLKHTEERSYTHRIKVGVYTQPWNRDRAGRSQNTWDEVCEDERRVRTELRSGPPPSKKIKAKGLVSQYEIYNLIRGDNSR